jgi:hypothetical protein
MDVPGQQRQKWLDRCDQAKATAGLRPGSELAPLLGITKGCIHQFRRGETELGSTTRLLLLIIIGTPWAGAVASELVPKSDASRFAGAMDAMRKRGISLAGSRQATAKDFAV